MHREIIRDLIPGADEMFGWVLDLTKLGHRKTGTPEGLLAAEYVRRRFEEFGLQHVRLEQVNAPKYDVANWSLTVQGEEVSSHFINHTFKQREKGVFDTGSKGIDAPVVYVGKGLEEDFSNVDVKGKIVLCDIKFHDFHLQALQSIASFFYDPRNTILKGVSHADPYTPNNFPYNYFYALQRGAVGFVGILEDYFDHCTYMNEDYTSRGKAWEIDWMNIPGLWISKSDGRRIKNAIEACGSVPAKITMRATCEDSVANNVVGYLPGKSKDIIMIHSHHDAVFEGGVEDASGTAEVLALAKYFGNMPPESRNKTLLFATMDTHFTGYQGHTNFIQRRKENRENVILDIALEHIGKEVIIEDGKAKLTGEVEFRGIFVTRHPKLLSITQEAVVHNKLERTLILPVTSDKKENCTDADYFFSAGYPIISLISPQIYIYDPMDTAEMVAFDQLEPIAATFAEIAQRADDEYDIN